MWIWKDRNTLKVSKTKPFKITIKYLEKSIEVWDVKGGWVDITSLKSWMLNVKDWEKLNKLKFEDKPIEIELGVIALYP